MKPNLCPRCGGEWIIYIVSGPLHEDFGYYVECEECGCTTETYRKENKAVKAWNEGEVKNALV